MNQNYQNLNILGLHLRKDFMLIERKLCRSMSKECMISLRGKRGMIPHVSRTVLFCFLTIHFSSFGVGIFVPKKLIIEHDRGRTKQVSCDCFAVDLSSYIYQCLLVLIVLLGGPVCLHEHDLVLSVPAGLAEASSSSALSDVTPCVYFDRDRIYLYKFNRDRIYLYK